MGTQAAKAIAAKDTEAAAGAATKEQERQVREKEQATDEKEQTTIDTATCNFDDSARAGSFLRVARGMGGGSRRT